jgi:hypothetical protein
MNLSNFKELINEANVYSNIWVAQNCLNALASAKVIFE